MAKRGQGEGTISKRMVNGAWDGTWWARITLGKDENGKQKRKAFYGKTRKEVQEKLTAAVNDKNKDVYVEPCKMTVSEWLITWLAEYKKPFLRLNTYRVYEQFIRMHINPELGQFKLKDLRPDMVQAHVNRLSEKGLAPASIDKAHSILSGALWQAVDNGMITKNVASRIKLPRKNIADIKVLTVEEQEILVNAIKANYCHGYEIFLMALGTGLRVGELLALTWDDIDFEAHCVKVSKTRSYLRDPSNPEDKYHDIIGPVKTKSGNRTVPLLPGLVTMLQTLKQHQEDSQNEVVTVLRNIRLSKGLSQREAEELTETTKGAFQMYEGGLNSPDIPTAKRIASTFKVPFNSLFGEKFNSHHGNKIRVRLLLEKTKHYNLQNIVFCDANGEPRKAEGVAIQLRRLARQVGIDNLHTHCLRHTFATRGLENGIELKVMQELLGHAGIKTTADIYTHVLPDKKAEDIMKLDGKLGF